MGSGSLSPSALPPGNPAPPARPVLQPGPPRPVTAGVLSRGAGEAVILSALRIGGHWAPEPRKKAPCAFGGGGGEGFFSVGEKLFKDP